MNNPNPPPTIRQEMKLVFYLIGLLVMFALGYYAGMLKQQQIEAKKEVEVIDSTAAKRAQEEIRKGKLYSKLAKERIERQEILDSIWQENLNKAYSISIKSDIYETNQELIERILFTPHQHGTVKDSLIKYKIPYSITFLKPE